MKPCIVNGSCEVTRATSSTTCNKTAEVGASTVVRPFIFAASDHICGTLPSLVKILVSFHYDRELRQMSRVAV